MNCKQLLFRINTCGKRERTNFELHYRKERYNTPLIIITVFCFLFMPVFQANAQSAGVLGQVIDAETGHPLVEVTVRTDARSTQTDPSGRFLLRLPPGEHLLTTQLTGYQSSQENVSVPASGMVTLSIALQSEFREGDRLYNRAYNRDIVQARALETGNPGSRNILTLSEIDRFEDFTVRDALIRMPGVQAGRRGEVNVRGAGLHQYNVTIDGLRMGSTAPAGREVDLDIFSREMLHNVELVKVLTPDMDADALGGTVNVNSWLPVGNRELDVRLGGVANPAIFTYSGLGNVASIRYAERYRDDFSMAVNISWQKDDRGFQTLGLAYDAKDFGNGPVDVIERVSPGFYLDERNRLNSRIQMTYQPTLRTTFTAQAAVLNIHRVRDHHQNSRWAGGDWHNPDSTGLAGSQGGYTYGLYSREARDQHVMAQLQGRHLLDFIHVEYRLGWIQSNLDQRGYQISFMRERLDYAIDMSDRTRPTMQISNFRLLEDGTLDRRQLNFEPTDRIMDEQLESRYSGRVDFEVPLSWISFRAGGNVQMTRSDRGYQEAAMQPTRNFDMMRFEAIPRGSITIMDHYFIPFLLNSQRIRNYVETNRPTMRIDEDDLHRRTELHNFYIAEDVYAAYGMTKVDLGPVTLLGGVRLEQTDATYEGRQAFFNRFGEGGFDSSVDVEESVSYSDLLPNAQLFFSPLEDMRMQLAYTRTMGRQDYNLLAPFLVSNASDTSRFMGNPNLKPTYSENLDFILEYALGYQGWISAGLFYKELTNMVVIGERQFSASSFPNLTIPEGETVQVTERQFINSDKKATIYGVELSWRQRLHFLPGALRNLGVYANYTWTQSELENARDSETEPLLFQSPHVINIALDYVQGRFSVQTAYHRTAESLYELPVEQVLAPSVNANNPVYMDRYGDGWKDLSATLGFRISENFRLWAGASNLLRSERIIYAENRDLYPYETDWQSGIRLTLGLRFTL